jgi:hypothetical protein
MIRCGKCRFWQGRDDNPLGTCRFNPPVLIVIDVVADTHFPETQAAEWCGKAEPRLDVGTTAATNNAKSKGLAAAPY